MASRSRTMTIEFLGDTSDLSKKMKTIDSDSDKTGRKLSDLGTAAKLALTGAAAGAAVAFGKEMFTMAATAEGVENRISTVFGDMAQSVAHWAETQASAFGKSTTEVKAMAAELGDLLIPMGFARHEAAAMTTDTLEAANALSEWTGGAVAVETAAEAVTKAMLGEREMLKQLGISLKEADISARLAANGQDELTGKALEQAKAIATQELIFEKSTDALNAYREGGNELLRDGKELTAMLAEQKQQLAQDLIPVLAAGASASADFAAGVRVVVDWVRELPDPAKEATVALGGTYVALQALKAHPIIAGLAVVVGAITAIGNQARKEAERIGDVAAALRDVGDAATELQTIFADEALAGLDRFHNAQQPLEDVADALNELGMTFSEVDRIIAGGPEAIQEWQDALHSGEQLTVRQNIAFLVLLDAMNDTIKTYGEATEANARYEEANRDVVAAQQAAAEAATMTGDAAALEALAFIELADSMSETEAATADATAALEHYEDRMRRLTDPAFALVAAQQDIAETTAAITELQREGKQGSDEWNEAIADRVAAELDAADASRTLIELGGIWDDGLRTMLASWGLTNDEIQEYINLVNEANTLGVPGAVNAGGSRSFGGTGTEARQHGGPVHAGTPYVVGEAGPEIVVPNTNGTVVANHQIRRPATSASAAAVGGAGTVNVYVSGSVVTERELIDTIRDALVQTARRNGSTGIT